MSDIYSVEQKKGWRVFTSLKQYSNIGEKQVSTYLPHMTNGSPCPNAELPSACEMVGKENVDERAATKWELTNQHGEHVYLWTDDRFEIAVRWQIENVTYELKHIHESGMPDSMLEVPAGHTHSAAFDFGR